MTTAPTLHSSPEELRYRAYTLNNFLSLPEVQRLSKGQRDAIATVAHVLPFKTNNYVVEQLIDWSNVPEDPIFVLNFPQHDMLQPKHYQLMARALEHGADSSQAEAAANQIRAALNPHPAGQLEHNVPQIYGERLTGMQHKYRETVLFFPSNGQTCHAYCSFCFRWPQFVGDDALRFAMRETDLLIAYLRAHEEVTDLLITGGDPMVMSARNLATYIDPILDARIPHLRTIRIGTKSLSYWPYKYTTDKGAEDVLALFRRVKAAGIHLAIMAHFNHPRELSTPVVEEAIGRILETGAQIRCQSPIMRNINDNGDAWAEMWKRQVSLGLIPYYMFVARDTGAQHYFSVPLVRAWEIFREAYTQVSGIARTVRGPSMSTDPGKIQVLGRAEVAGRRVLGLNFIQARNTDWVARPFFARYDEKAAWLDDLRPAFGETEFFFEPELRAMFEKDAAARLELQKV
jgi:KamA family protein